MYKKKLIQKLIGATLCLSLLGNEAVPVLAQEGKVIVQETEEAGEVVSQLTPEVPVQRVQGDAVSRYPVGGVEKTEHLELPEEAEGVEVFSEETDSDELLSIEEQEEVNAGLFSTYGYSTLNASEKAVYNLLKSRLFAFDTSSKNAVCVHRTTNGSYYAAELVNVSSYQMTLTQMERIYFALEADYPMLFWIDDTVGYFMDANKKFVVSWYIMVEPDYYQSSTRKSASQSIQKGMLPFLEEIDNAKANGADDMELELLIHDMIINEVDYAYNSSNKPETAAFAHSVVGVLDGNSGTDVVCEGYAKTFQLLATYAGLESIYAVGMSGTGFNRGGHAWNLVKIDGSWYNIDLTWDDANDTEYDGYFYDFFNLATSVFNANKEHDYCPNIFAGMYTVPNATATKAEYYNYFGLRVAEADIKTEDQFIGVMKNAISSNEKRRDNLLRFQCDSEETMEVLEAYLSDSSTCSKLYKQLNSNGVKYEKTAILEYYNYKQLLVSISKVYVENMCDGYVFGNPKTDAAVYDWTNRVVTNVTEDYDFNWSGNNKLTIKKDAETLGSYQYTTVTPVIGNIAAVSYTGNGICPKVSVTVNGTLLQNQKDFVVAYSNNVNPGTAKVTIKGIGKYAGTAEKTFTIQKGNLANMSATLSVTQCAYDGTAKTPEVIVNNAGNTLVAGKDFTVTYRNNTNPGQATAVINGIGNYQGSKTLNFIIVPGKPGSLKLSKGTGKTLSFSWKKQTGASGYEVSLYKGNSKVKVTTTTKNTYQFSKLKTNTQYTFRVRAYKTINGSKKYGAVSNQLVVKTASNTPTGLKITAGNRSASLKWKKISGVTGYEIYMSTNSKSGYKKVATIRSASKVKYTKKKLTPKKTYYFKIRSYTTKNGQKAYSSYTAVKKVKIK